MDDFEQINQTAIDNNLPFAWEPESKAEIDVSEMFININKTQAPANQGCDLDE